MRILHINMTYDFGSTGRFIRYIKEALESKGDICSVVCGFSPKKDPSILVTQSRLVSKIEIVLGRLFGNHGLNCFFQTKKALRFIRSFAPDVIHLHNLHGDYINFRSLFRFIKKHNIPVVWKLPDCWAFTGHCVYYDYVRCYSWKNKCGSCPQKKQYPVSWVVDRSRYMLRQKKKAFSGVQSMVLCPPSDWLKGEVNSSYLNQYPITTVNNGIDDENFRPYRDEIIGRIRDGKRVIILGVVFSFDIRKGLDSFNYLAERLPDDYQIIIVGFNDTNNYMNKKIKMVPRTTDVILLAHYYSAADIFVNPTLEENFPSVNIESLACGTPIIAYKTGGAAEVITEKTGIVVERDDKKTLLEKVLFVGENSPFHSEDCVERSKKYSKKAMVSKYLSLYKGVSLKK